MGEQKAFASVEELEQRFRRLSSDERGRAAAWLDDAAVLLRSELARAGVSIESDDEIQASTLRVVSCSMVKRALVSLSGESATQTSTTVGPFSRSISYANPTADLYLTKQERRILGIAGGSVGVVFGRPVMNSGDCDA